MRRATLLVADRNPRFLEKTAEILAEGGHQMISVEDGQAARAALSAKGGRDLDGVLCHASLPGLSGFALCRIAKELDPTLPVVLMFSAEDPRGELEAKRAGADNWLVRPLKRLELLYIVRDVILLRATLMRAQRAADERARFELSSGRDGQALEPGAGRLIQFELFKRLLHIELKRSQRYGFPLSLLVASLDPPARGAPPPLRDDRDLLATAARAAIRDIDIPVAFGESDVLVVMPHTDGAGAKLVAERIKKRVRATQGGRAGGGITVSIGVVSVEGGDRITFAALLAQASRAQKSAAEAGGDRVVVAGLA
jgi:PleD family two-component response regulator